MKKLASGIILIIFTAWVLPLGAFFKPEQEKTACNGERAICLCTHIAKKQAAKMDGQQYFKYAGNTDKEKGGSSSFGLEFIHTINNAHDFNLAKNTFYLISFLNTRQIFARPIEHVPLV